MADIVIGVVAHVKRVSRSGNIYLTSQRFPRDIELKPQQVKCAGFNPKRLVSGNQLIVDVRVENGGNLKTSQIRSYNGHPARAPGPVAQS